VSWEEFWAVVFVAAFAGFAIVSGLIAVKGLSEIRELLELLKQGRGKD